MRPAIRSKWRRIAKFSGRGKSAWQRGMLRVTIAIPPFRYRVRVAPTVYRGCGCTQVIPRASVGIVPFKEPDLGFCISDILNFRMSMRNCVFLRVPNARNHGMYTMAACLYPEHNIHTCDCVPAEHDSIPHESSRAYVGNSRHFRLGCVTRHGCGDFQKV